MERFNSHLLRHAFDLELALRTVLMRFVETAADTEELLQRIYARLLRVPAAEQERLQFPRAFIGFISRNALLEFMQSKNMSSPKGMSHADISEQLDAYQEVIQVAEIVEKLPTRLRQAFTLRMIYGWSNKQIGKRLELSTRTVDRYVRVALSRMSERDREQVERDAGASAAKSNHDEVSAAAFYDVSKEILVPSTEVVRVVAPRIVNASTGLAEQLKHQPESVYELAPLEFEQLIAELLRNLGYQVTVTRATRDGGKDLLAYLPTEFGTLLCLVEAKRYRRDRKVGVELVRSLYGTLIDARASSAMLITTSSFTSEAQEFQRRHKYQLTLRDYRDLVRWIQQYKCAPKPEPVAERSTSPSTNGR